MPQTSGATGGVQAIQEPVDGQDDTRRHEQPHLILRKGAYSWRLSIACLSASLHISETKGSDASSLKLSTTFLCILITTLTRSVIATFVSESCSNSPKVTGAWILPVEDFEARRGPETKKPGLLEEEVGFLLEAERARGSAQAAFDTFGALGVASAGASGGNCLFNSSLLRSNFGCQVGSESLGVDLFSVPAEGAVISPLVSGTSLVAASFSAGCTDVADAFFCSSSSAEGVVAAGFSVALVSGFNTEESLRLVAVGTFCTVKGELGGGVG